MAENREPEVYTEDEMAAIEQYIENTFGEFENCSMSWFSPDIHVDHLCCFTFLRSGAITHW